MGKKPEIKFERVQMSDPNPPIKSGTKIRITDKKLPGYNQEFYISHKPFVDSDLYSYMKDPRPNHL